MRKKKFDGSISEIMVAYQPNQELDFGPVRKMVEFQIKNGIDGLFMGGLSTQTYLLTMEEKRRVGEELCNAAAGRVPVMMNVMEDSIKNAKQLVQDYMDIGVDAVCISQPSVFPYTEQALVEFFDEVIPEDYPTYIYNVPQTGNTMSPRTVARIANAHPNVLGYKDSTQNISALQDLLLQVNYPDFQCIAGSDALDAADVGRRRRGCDLGHVRALPEGHPCHHRRVVQRRPHWRNAGAEIFYEGA